MISDDTFRTWVIKANQEGLKGLAIKDVIIMPRNAGDSEMESIYVVASDLVKPSISDNMEEL